MISHLLQWNPFQIILVPVCTFLALLALARTIRRTTPRRIGLLTALLWLAAAFTISFPGSTIRIANLVGIGRGADLVLYLAVFAGIVVSSYYYQRCRELEIMVTEVMRRMALQDAQRGGQKDKT